MSLERLLARYRRARRNYLFIVSGPSGAGKTVLCKQVAADLPGLLYSISYTTRARREAEVDGRDYFFLDRSRFQAKIEAGDFLEWAEVHGNYYGTCKDWVRRKLAEGRDIILDIDVQGARQLAGGTIPTCSIFVVPPSMEILRLRLQRRGSDSSADITRRLRNAEAEIEQAVDYQYLIINDELSQAKQSLAAIIRARRCLFNL